jgi:zinc/manganese transport system substrate-binding protein
MKITVLIQILCIALVIGVRPAWSDVYVFACEPEWAALAEELGGDKVSAFVATNARQDPHHIRARPSLIAKVRRADMIFCSGAGLEAGWLPILMQRGARATTQPGRPGYLMASEHVPVLGKPAVVDRSMGDVHPEGNPHVHLDPRNVLRVAAELTSRLVTIDPSNRRHYEDLARTFTAGWRESMTRWARRARALKGMKVIVHHTSFTYLIAWLELDTVATLEPKPGLPPTASHLEEVLRLTRTQPIKAILRTPYDPARAAEWLSGKANIPVRVLPYTVGGNPKAKTLKALFDLTLSSLEGAARER